MEFIWSDVLIWQRALDFKYVYKTSCIFFVLEPILIWAGSSQLYFKWYYPRQDNISATGVSLLWKKVSYIWFNGQIIRAKTHFNPNLVERRSQESNSGP